MKVGDVVLCYYGQSSKDVAGPDQGLIVGFNKKGEGGQDYVHVLVNGEVILFTKWDLEVVK